MFIVKVEVGGHIARIKDGRTTFKVLTANLKVPSEVIEINSGPEENLKPHKHTHTHNYIYIHI